jgi:CBS domain-containing protein
MSFTIAYPIENILLVCHFIKESLQAKKMRDKKVSSLVVTDRGDEPIGIVTERDLVRQVCTKDVNSNAVIVHHIMSSPMATIDANSSVEVAADIMIQNKYSIYLLGMKTRY